MSNQTLNLTDSLYKYLLSHSLCETRDQYDLRQHTSQLEMSQMQIAPEQGRFMSFLVKLLNVRKIIEVGVYTGYSSLSMALSLPNDGQLLACDINKEWTEIAKEYWERAGVDHKIKLEIAPAVDTLQKLLEQGSANQFDMAFIDADKVNYDSYYELCLKLIHPGALILIDNTLWGGAVADLRINDPDTCSIRQLNKKIKNDPRVEICMMPIADGLTLIRKL